MAGPDGNLMHAVLMHNDSPIMMGPESPGALPPPVLRASICSPTLRMLMMCVLAPPPTEQKCCNNPGTSSGESRRHHCAIPMDMSGGSVRTSKT